MTAKPLQSEDQHRFLRMKVESYRAAMAQAEYSRRRYVEAEAEWKDDLARCEEIKDELAKYVDNRRDCVVVTLDNGNIACLISFVDGYGIACPAHVSFLPVSGYEHGPSVDPQGIRPDDLSDCQGYEYAGKLGTWERHGAEGERYLAVGLQHKPTYKRIISATRDKMNGRMIVVLLEGSAEPNMHGMSTNTYTRR